MREDVAIVSVQKGIAMHPELGRQGWRGSEGICAGGRGPGRGRGHGREDRLPRPRFSAESVNELGSFQPLTLNCAPDATVGSDHNNARHHLRPSRHCSGALITQPRSSPDEAAWRAGGPGLDRGAEGHRARRSCCDRASQGPKFQFPCSVPKRL